MTQGQCNVAARIDIKLVYSYFKHGQHHPEATMRHIVNQPLDYIHSLAENTYMYFVDFLPSVSLTSWLNAGMHHFPHTIPLFVGESDCVGQGLSAPLLAWQSHGSQWEARDGNTTSQQGYRALSMYVQHCGREGAFSRLYSAVTQHTAYSLLRSPLFIIILCILWRMEF